MIREISTKSLLGALALSCMFLASTAAAATCSATVEGNDAMQFSTKVLVVPSSCKKFTVTLKHTGKLPKTAMGHNFVLGKSADITGINADGMKAGVARNYVKPGDARVIASSKVIGGGESATIIIPMARLKAGEKYSYICSFPGHASIMKGTLSLGK